MIINAYNYIPSDDFKNAIKEDVRAVRIELKIKFSDNTTRSFYDKDIVKESLYIDRRLVNGDDFEIGCLNSAELGVKILWNDNPYLFRGATITPYFGIWIKSKNDWEDVMLGKFNVSEIERCKGYVDIKALDDLAKMSYDVIPRNWYDKQLDGNNNFLYFRLKSKSLGDIIIDCLDNYNISYDDRTFNVNLINTLSATTVYTPNFADRQSIPTYRDLLSSALQLIGRSGIIKRNGEFAFGTFSKEQTLTLTPFDRFSLTYSDHEVRDMTLCFDSEDASASFGKGNYPVHLDDNFLLKDLSSSSITTQLENAYNSIDGLSYVPCTIEYPGDPTIELGEMIKVEPIIPSVCQKVECYGELSRYNRYIKLNGLKYGKRSDFLCPAFKTVVMHHNWVYRGKSTIHSYGKNWLLRGIYKKKRG